MGFFKFSLYLGILFVAFGRYFNEIDVNFLWLGLCVLCAGAIAYSREDTK